MKNKTNTEFVTELMEYSKHGALMQLFIIDALIKHSDRVVEHEAEVLQVMENSMIHGPAWVGCAKELKKALENRNNA
jgi:hypothetical protein